MAKLRIATISIVVKASLAVLALGGMALLLYGMRLGPGIGGDATIYITSAQNLIQGNGLGLIGPRGEFRLIPYFPPFFSLVLACFGLVGLDMTPAAQWLNTLLFGGMIYLAGALTWRYSRALLPSLLAGLMLAVSPVLIPVYSWAMSEPLSIFLGFTSLGCILLYLEMPSKRTWLYGAAILGGFSFLTRYGSVAFLGTGALVVLVMGGQGWIRKIKDTLAYSLLGSLPMLAWLVYDYQMTATVASRRMETAAGLAVRVASFWQNFQELFLFWLIPESWIYDATPYPAWVNRWLVILFWLGLAAGFGWIMWRAGRTKTAGPLKLAWVLGLFIIVYTGVVAAISFTTYPPITIANRMFSPVHIATIWLMTVLLALGWQTLPKQKWVWVGLLAALFVFSGMYAWRTVRIVGQYRKTGLGYTSVAWRESPTIAALKALPPDKIVVTNETMAVLYLTGRSSYPLMEIYWTQPGTEFKAYGDGDLSNDASQRLFRQEGAPLVLFDTIYEQMSQLYGGRANERVKRLTQGLYEAFKGHDGAIYYYRQTGR